MVKQDFKLEIGGKELKVEINNLAEQASGSVFVQYGETLVLATATMAQEIEGRDFFPLTVEYEERFYAAGKILGSRFVRRENKPTDEAILTSRLIDRAIRPRFPKNFKKEIQVVITCLSWDTENDPDVVGLIAASLALGLSDIPWLGPIAAVRIGRDEQNFVVNPTYSQREKTDLDFTVSALLSEKGGLLLNMIEADGNEKEENSFTEAFKVAEPELIKLIDFQKEIIKKFGREKIKIEENKSDLALIKEIKDFLGDKLATALYQPAKSEKVKEDKSSFSPFAAARVREEAINDLKIAAIQSIEEKYPGQKNVVIEFIEDEINRLVHENILKTEKRPDGRKIDELRELDMEAGLLPRTHGSAIFCRGQTKALSILTLGSPEDVRLLEGMETRGKKRFMHHYNFPPYCSGEVKPMRGPGRREIGHGMLAEKALLPLVPSFEDFPYTMRIVTEILSSNGSTSMASVSSSCLALMDAGVPIKSAVAGISIGLMLGQNGDYKILTDIQGPEDHYGDMDFKVAGTKKGITAIQMDVKIDGITTEIFQMALDRAKKTRLLILEKMAKVLPNPRPQLSPHAPRIIILQINPEKIREVIGPGGKVINEIIEECGVTIDIEDSGRIFVTAEKEAAADKAVDWIKNLTREVKPGEIFQGKVKRILDFGAFVEIFPGQEGLVHISQLADSYIKKVEDVVKVGDIIPVKVIEIDEQGRINLSLKEAKIQRE